MIVDYYVILGFCVGLRKQQMRLLSLQRWFAISRVEWNFVSENISRSDAANKGNDRPLAVPQRDAQIVTCVHITRAKDTRESFLRWSFRPQIAKTSPDEPKRFLRDDRKEKKKFSQFLLKNLSLWRTYCEASKKCLKDLSDPRKKTCVITIGECQWFYFPPRP